MQAGCSEDAWLSHLSNRPLTTLFLTLSPMLLCVPTQAKYFPIPRCHVSCFYCQQIVTFSVSSVFCLNLRLYTAIPYGTLVLYQFISLYQILILHVIAHNKIGSYRYRAK